MSTMERRKKAAWMRKWRANPVNRTREAARGYDNYVRREATRAFEPPRRNPNQCHFCHFPAITTVERFVVRGGEYVPIEVPYCGVC